MTTAEVLQAIAEEIAKRRISIHENATTESAKACAMLRAEVEGLRCAAHRLGVSSTALDDEVDRLMTENFTNKGVV